jgi:hypothetical protein
MPQAEEKFQHKLDVMKRQSKNPLQNIKLNILE